MGRLGQIALVLLVAVLAVVAQACTASAARATSAISAPPGAGSEPATVGSPKHLPDLPPDAAGQGRVLTDYFLKSMLPLVAASVVDDKCGHQVILYGFVATAFGKTYAEGTARRIFHDPKVVVVNRILVEPALVTVNEAAEGGDSSLANASDADVQSYLASDTASAYEQSVQQPPPPRWLEGWYLLMPPVNWMTMRRDRFAPLGRWEHLASFNRAEDCEKIRFMAVEKLYQERPNACEDLAYKLLCVPTDDWRLKR